jgi:hypothetical protein
MQGDLAYVLVGGEDRKKLRVAVTVVAFIVFAKLGDYCATRARVIAVTF